MYPAGDPILDPILNPKIGLRTGFEDVFMDTKKETQFLPEIHPLGKHFQEEFWCHRGERNYKRSTG